MHTHHMIQKPHSLIFTQRSFKLIFTQKSFKLIFTQKICTWMFIIEHGYLFINAQAWKQLRCPSIGEWINKLQHIKTMKYYLALKKISCQATKGYG